MKNWLKEHAALLLSLATNVGLTAGIVWQHHTIVVYRELILKMWFVIQILQGGGSQ